MKTYIAILCAAFLVCGCDQNTQSEPKRFEYAEMFWVHGATNGALIIQTERGMVKKNVTTLTQAANMAGEYGWEFVQRYDDGTHEVFCLKRQTQTNGWISLVSDLSPQLRK